MKKLALSFAVCLAALFCSAIDADELGTLALKDAIGEAEKALASAPVPKGQPVAVLPLAGDSEGGIWSDTVSASETFKVGSGSWWDQLRHAFPWLQPWMMVAIPVGLVVLLVLLRMFFRATTRVR